MKKLNTLYRVIRGKSNSFEGGSFIPIQLIGNPVNISIHGGEAENKNQVDVLFTDLANLAPQDSPFLLEGIYTFVTIPQYIAVMGVGDGFEISNVNLYEIKYL